RGPGCSGPRAPWRRGAPRGAPPLRGSWAAVVCSSMPAQRQRSRVLDVRALDLRGGAGAGEPGFCKWVVRESQKDDASERLTDFAEWLQEQGVSPFSDGLVGFSKHADLTYEEALEQEPGFCKWVLSRASATGCCGRARKTTPGGG
ncbi:unnamed protein product, partial [Prorocentrum cordatum]